MRLVTSDDGERGQITLLSIGFGVLALTLVLVVAASSSIYLERKQLLALADGAAADAADAIDYGLYYGGERDGLPLSDASVQEAVAGHLQASAAASTFSGLRIGPGTGTSDGRTAQVTLSATARPAVVPWVLAPWSDGFAITVSSSARAD